MDSSNPNPIKELRLTLGLPQEVMAERMGMTRMALLRYEQGFHSTLSPKVITFFKENDENFTTIDELIIRYINFQRSSRLSNYGLLDPNIDFSVYHTGNELTHPLLYWMENSKEKPNLTQLSKGFCLHHPTMHRFITKPYIAIEIPKCLEDGLKEAGYSISCRTAFHEAYSKWRSFKYRLFNSEV